MIDIEQYPLEYIHDCGRASFYITCKPVSGSMVHHEDIILPDGSYIIPGDLSVCFYCGSYLDFRTENVRARQ